MRVCSWHSICSAFRALSFASATAGLPPDSAMTARKTSFCYCLFY